MTANAAQQESWNGDNGRHFVSERVRLDRMLEAHTERLMAAAGIGPGDTVLDVGCGCGETTLHAARAATGGSVLGVDISAVMLDEARRLAESERAGDVEFERMDVQSEPLPAAAFDVALSRFGVMFFEDPRAAFANVAAALRPGGRLAFVCWQEARKVDYFRLPVKAIASEVGPPERPAPGEPGPFSLADPERIRAVLAGAGFGDVEVADLDARSWFGRDADDVIDYYRGMPMVRSMLAGAGDEAAERAFKTLRDALVKRESEDGVHFAAAAWLVTASR